MARRLRGSIQAGALALLAALVPGLGSSQEDGGSIDALERAAAQGHDAIVELDLTRAYLQAGRYRQALGFAAHVVAEHRDSTEPAALYAWMLAAGGQAPYARRVLDEASRSAPADALVQATREALEQPAPIATGTLLEAHHRMAPLGDALPATEAQVVSTGVLLDERHALVPLAAIRGRGRLWLRNGLGQATGATQLREQTELGVALLQLDAPLPMAPAAEFAPREPFAGSPGFVAAYAPTAGSAPAWPWLRMGFLGRAAGGERPLRQLGIAAPSSAIGAPVFDAAGRLAGITLPAVDGALAWLPWPMLAGWAGMGPATPPAASVPQRSLPADLAYERALRIALQVVASE